MIEQLGSNACGVFAVAVAAQHCNIHGRYVYTVIVIDLYYTHMFITSGESIGNII